MKSHPLLAELVTIAPSVAFTIHWEHDQDAGWDRLPHDIAYPGNALAGEDPDNWQAWQSEVRATAVHSGKEITGSEYLGGTWEKAVDHPSESNPDISGYLPQMLKEAAEELRHQLPADSPLAAQLLSAENFLTERMRSNYEAQQTASS